MSPAAVQLSGSHAILFKGLAHLDSLRDCGEVFADNWSDVSLRGAWYGGGLICRGLCRRMVLYLSCLSSEGGGGLCPSSDRGMHISSIHFVRKGNS